MVSTSQSLIKWHFTTDITSPLWCVPNINLNKCYYLPYFFSPKSASTEEKTALQLFLIFFFSFSSSWYKGFVVKPCINANVCNKHVFHVKEENSKISMEVERKYVKIFLHTNIWSAILKTVYAYGFFFYCISPIIWLKYFSYLWSYHLSVSDPLWNTYLLCNQGYTYKESKFL